MVVALSASSTALSTGSAATASRAREGAGIIARRARPQRDALAVFASDDAIAAELDLMQPTGAGRRPAGERRLTRQDEALRLRTSSDRPGNAPERTGPAI